MTTKEMTENLKKMIGPGKISQQTVAKVLGCSLQNVNQYIRGNSDREITPQQYERFMEAIELITNNQVKTLQDIKKSSGL